MKLISLIMFIILLCSCSNKQEITYKLSYMYIIKNEDKEKVERFVTNVVEAASKNLTTEDYEDIDDTIEEAAEAAAQLYQTKVICLAMYRNSLFITRIPYYQLTKVQEEIFDSLKTIK